MQSEFVQANIKASIGIMTDPNSHPLPIDPFSQQVSQFIQYPLNFIFSQFQIAKMTQQVMSSQTYDLEIQSSKPHPNSMFKDPLPSLKMNTQISKQQ